MTSDPYYVLNRNADGSSVLHRDPGESCNTQADEMPGRTVIDPKTGAALEASGDVRLCKHCIDTDSED